jgi:hypothetical protein
MKQITKADKVELKAIQQSMGHAVGASFSASELEALHVLIRITVEFHRDLKNKKHSNYAAATVFSGIDSFMSLTHSYGVLDGAELQSQLQWKRLSPASLKGEFTKLYRRFVAQEAFEPRARLLLDLFKLQIAFATVTYDCKND